MRGQEGSRCLLRETRVILRITRTMKWDARDVKKMYAKTRWRAASDQIQVFSGGIHCKRHLRVVVELSESAARWKTDECRFMLNTLRNFRRRWGLGFRLWSRIVIFSETMNMERFWQLLKRQCSSTQLSTSHKRAVFPLRQSGLFLISIAGTLLWFSCLFLFPVS